MPSEAALHAALRRDRLIVAAVLLVLTLLAWAHVASGSGTGMSAWHMTRLALFPNTASHGAPAAPWSAATWGLMAAMWWVMMIAMMVPGAAPLILLYGRVRAHAERHGQPVGTAFASFSLVAGYLSAWLAFSLMAVALQWVLDRIGLTSTMMQSRSAWLSSAIFIGAGLYQLSSLKRACLARCRAPADFLWRHWRPGAAGAFRMGAEHGVYCVGCCWMLMALLFVGGLMNLVWIALLSAFVLIEKLLPVGPVAGRVAGVLLVVWGVATLMT